MGWILCIFQTVNGGNKTLCGACACLQRRTCDSLKYAEIASMHKNTRTMKTVITTFFLFADFSFSAFRAVMGFLWRPGRGTTGKSTAMKKISQDKGKDRHSTLRVQHLPIMNMKPSDRLPGCLEFNGLIVSSGTWMAAWGNNNNSVHYITWEKIHKSVIASCCISRNMCQ